MATRISCDAHDYFEIVCMRHSQIMVTTHNNEIISGTAININLIDKQEVLELKGQETSHHIQLTNIKRLLSIKDNIDLNLPKANSVIA